MCSYEPLLEMVGRTHWTLLLQGSLLRASMLHCQDTVPGKMPRAGGSPDAQAAYCEPAKLLRSPSVAVAVVRGALKPGGCVPARTPVSMAPCHTVPGSGWHRTACRPRCWWSRAAALRPSRPAQGQTELRQGQGAGSPQHTVVHAHVHIYTQDTHRDAHRNTETHGCTHKHTHTHDTPAGC